MLDMTARSSPQHFRVQVVKQKIEFEFDFDDDIFTGYGTGARFAEIFGNAYVNGVYQGGRFQAYLLRTRAENETKEDMEAKVSLVCDSKAYGSANVKAEFERKTREAFSLENTKFYLFTEGEQTSEIVPSHLRRLLVLFWKL